MKRFLVVLLAAVAVGAGYVLVRGAGVLREAADLAEDGGERVLRETLRPARGGVRVLVLALDGVGRTTLYQAIERGQMPRLGGLMGAGSTPASRSAATATDSARPNASSAAADRPTVDGTDATGIYPHAYAAPDVLSVLPSTTMAAWASVFTGEPPARTGVPGNEWFDRQTMTFSAPAPVTVSGYEHTLAMLDDGFVGHAISTPTLFERANVRSYVSVAPVYRGADIFTLPEPDLVLELFAAVARGVTGDEPLEREAYASLDVASVDNVLETIELHGLADLQVVYFAAVDLFTHGATEPLEQQELYLADIVDPQIGRLLDAYARLGALDSTYVVVISDHGHTPVLNDDRHALEPEGEHEPQAVLERAGFRPRPLVLEPEEDELDYQSVLAYQGAIAYVYLADRSTCPEAGRICDWRRPPRLEEDVLPVARAFEAASRSGEGVPELAGALDLIMVRVPNGGGASRIEVVDEGRLVPLREYLERHPRPDLLRFEERMDELVNGPHGDRAGDVLLLARTGGHRPIEDRFYFSSLYRSWHGSPHPQDSEIPLIVARAGMDGAGIGDVVRWHLGEAPSQLGFMPLVLGLLEK